MLSMISPLPPTKSSIRAILLKKRENLTPKLVQSLSSKIANNLINLPEIKSKKNFLLYLALPKEVQTKQIINKLLGRKASIYLPYYRSDLHLRPGLSLTHRRNPRSGLFARFLRLFTINYSLFTSLWSGLSLGSPNDYAITSFTNWQDIEESPYQILQPKNQSPIHPEIIDVAIIPGVAFDINGTRVGYGKGVFDKLLANSKALKIGLAYDFQMLEKPIAKESHDVTVDMVVSEKSIYRPLQSITQAKTWP